MKHTLLIIALLWALGASGQIYINSFTFEAAPISTDTCGAFIAPGVWKKFLCHNLGANTALDPSIPHFGLNGHYIVVGRNPTCFGFDGIDAPNPCSSPVYGIAAPFNATTTGDNAGAVAGWDPTASLTGWGVPKTINDPCPTGWRVPTQTEWQGVVANNTITRVGAFNAGTANYTSGARYGTSLFLPAAGYRNNTLNSGALVARNSIGFYAAQNGARLAFSATINEANNFSTFVGTIRCIEE